VTLNVKEWPGIIAHEIFRNFDHSRDDDDDEE
jgi:hypothetical protein